MEIKKKGIVWGVVAFLALILAFGSFYTINTGERGVVLRLGKLDSVVGEGLHVKLPFFDEVHKMSIRDRNLSVKTEVSSSDIQTIAVTVDLVYSLDPNKMDYIYQTYGTRIEETLVHPTLAEKSMPSLPNTPSRCS